MSAPPPVAGLDQQLQYVIQRLDRHLDDHEERAAQALRDQRAAVRNTVLIALTLLATVATWVSILITHH